MKAFIIILSLFSSLGIFSQHEISFKFEARIETNSKLKINQLKYYISSIVLFNNGQRAFVERDSYHLIDHNDASSTIITLQLSGDVEYDEIQFNIGIDSITNMQGIHGGDLDPTKGMYWTWQSGYINFKLETEIDDKEISYHIGGFMYPNNACRKVELKLSGKSDNYTIMVSPENLIDQVDYKTTNHVMSPGKVAMELADQLPGIFEIK